MFVMFSEGLLCKPSSAVSAAQMVLVVTKSPHAEDTMMSTYDCMLVNPGCPDAGREN